MQQNMYILNTLSIYKFMPMYVCAYMSIYIIYDIGIETIYKALCPCLLK